MGLTYHFRFRASNAVLPETLEMFLQELEGESRQMGFHPTAVVNGPFNNRERRDFARRVARGLTVEDDRLREVQLLKEAYWSHGDGYCRLAPEYGVLLILTDERGHEIVFGFFRYPSMIHDRFGREIMRTPGDGAWMSADCVKSSDPRLRSIVRRFAAAGYLESELDEFTAETQRS